MLEARRGKRGTVPQHTPIELRVPLTPAIRPQGL